MLAADSTLTIEKAAAKLDMTVEQFREAVEALKATVNRRRGCLKTIRQET
uniref:Putative transposase YhgA-like protein n=1 Tax=uncultured bacterium Ad_125_D08 TaxID=1489285 RepID=A0A0B4N0Z2_9BACT|nr:putative transposase YhgA-like protein [uncultured bacterium Ad_125_D08]